MSNKPPLARIECGRVENRSQGLGRRTMALGDEHRQTLTPLRHFHRCIPYTLWILTHRVPPRSPPPPPPPPPPATAWLRKPHFRVSYILLYIPSQTLGTLSVISPPLFDGRRPARKRYPSTEPVSCGLH